MYPSGKNANISISRLRHDFAIISEWFYENYTVLNAGECHFLPVGFNESFPDFSISNTTIENVTEQNILGIVINNKLNFYVSFKKIYAKRLTKNSVHSHIKINNP